MSPTPIFVMLLDPRCKNELRGVGDKHVALVGVLTGSAPDCHPKLVATVLLEATSTTGSSFERVVSQGWWPSSFRPSGSTYKQHDEDWATAAAANYFDNIQMGSCC